MKTISSLALAALLLGGTSNEAATKAQTDSCGRPNVEKVEHPNTTWQPGPDGEQLQIWPEQLEIKSPEMHGETGEMVGSGSPLIAGKTWNFATFVSRPTMTVFKPKGDNAGAAILVLPGGGYAAVAMDLEGTEICDWITQHGVTCVVLKYRTPYLWSRAKNGVQVPPEGPPLPLLDAQRAMSLLRFKAEARDIDPDRIGVIGFSSGAHLAAALSNADQRSYDPVDAADAQSSRPSFAIVMYPGRFLPPGRTDTDLSLAPWMKISPVAPPTFLVHAMDDPSNDPRHAMAYALALSDVGVPVDMRMFAAGCHAFGLRPTSDPVTRQWPDLALQWLRDRGIL